MWWGGGGGGRSKGKNMGRVMKRASAGGEAERNTVIVHGAGTVRPLSGIVSRMSRLCSFFAGQYVGAVLSPFGFVFGHGAVAFADLLVVFLRCCVVVVCGCCCYSFSLTPVNARFTRLAIFSSLTLQRARRRNNYFVLR